MHENETVSKSNQTKSHFGFDPEFHVPLIIIAVLVIISNMLVIVLFFAKEELRKGGKLLLLSLAFSDAFTGLVTIPLNIACEVTFSVRFCVSSGILNRFLAISTVYHILAVTFETYFAILRPMEHRVKIERRKILAIVLGIWLGALVIAVAPLFWTIGKLTSVQNRPGDEFLRKMSIYEIFVISFGFLFPLTLMIFAHARMFSRILKALKLIRRRSSPSRKSCSTNKNKYKTAILFAVILLVFTTCWLFWFVTGLLTAVFRKEHSLPQWAIDALTIVRYSTSFINPLLYTFFRPDFYSAFVSFVRGRNRRRPSVTLTYLLSNSVRAKRDSQTASTMLREPSIAPIIYITTPQNSSSKSTEKDTEV